MNKLISLLLSIAAAGAQASSLDPHTYAEPELVKIAHIELHLRADFARKVLAGWARLTIDGNARTSRLRLDSSQLRIARVTEGIGEVRTQEKGTTFEVGPHEDVRGEPLDIPLRIGARTVTIYYETDPAASGTVWLDPAYTTSGSKPYLYTQSESIYARSWIPCQDTPSVRTTYSADIEVPRGLLALMSADNPRTKNATGRYHFEQKRTVPSYLITLVAGEIEFRAIGARTGVYAEPAMLDRASKEFAELEQILRAGERLFGPYLWGRYDLLVMPKSFAFGGMENPQLTYVMPDAITGTKSQVVMATHELSHSWTGNVATNASWNDFWLNEGWTVYGERTLAEEVFGREKRDLLDFFNNRLLEDDLRNQPARFTRLRTDLASNESPEDAYTLIPYEKGYDFLRAIEARAGVGRFRAFARSYVNHFRFASVSTDDFLKFFESSNVLGGPDLARKVEARTWVEDEGMPASFHFREPPVIKRLRGECAAWLKGTAHFSRGLGMQEKAAILQLLPSKLSLARMKDLDAQLGLSGNADPDVQLEWQKKIIRGNHESLYGQVRAYFHERSRDMYLTALVHELRACAAGGEFLARELVEREAGRLYVVTLRNLRQIVNAPIGANERCAN